MFTDAAKRLPLHKQISRQGCATRVKLRDDVSLRNRGERRAMFFMRHRDKKLGYRNSGDYDLRLIFL